MSPSSLPPRYYLLCILLLCCFLSPVFSSVLSSRVHPHRHVINSSPDSSLSAYSSGSFTPLSSLRQYSVTRPVLKFRGPRPRVHTPKSLIDEHQFALMHAQEGTQSTVGALDFDLHYEYLLSGFGRDLHLVLHKNEQLFSPGYFEEDQRGNRKSVSSADRHCYFQGHLRDDPEQSRVAVSICDHQLRAWIYLEPRSNLTYSTPLEGSEWFQHGKPEILIVEPTTDRPASEGFDSGDHLVYRLRDVKLKQEKFSCGHEHDFEDQFKMLPKQQTNAASEASGAGSPSRASRTLLQPATRWINLLIVNDNLRLVQRGGQTETTSSAIANIADTIFAGTNFNPPLRIMLTGQVTFSTSDPYSASFNAQSEALVSPLLTNFLQWSFGRGFGTQYSNRVLISGYDFESSVIGYAPVGGMCISSQSGSIVQGRNFPDANVASTLAHELGHNIGLTHDGSTAPGSTTSSCPTSGFVMASIATFSPATQFSFCSLTDYTAWFTRNNPTCMPLTPGTPYDVGICGNGILEGQEKCDCTLGNRAACQAADPCCNYTSCRLFPGSQCSNNQTCCKSDCTLRTRAEAHVCRPAVHSTCDFPEQCDGISASCPLNTFADAGVGCTATVGNFSYPSGRCYAGQCHQADATCRNYNINWSSCPNWTPAGNTTYCSRVYCNTGSSCSIPGGSGTAPGGTPCGTNRQCNAGGCVDTSILNTIGNTNDGGNSLPFSEYLDALSTTQKIIIAVGSVVGVTLLCCICSYCKRRSRLKEEKEALDAYAISAKRKRDMAGRMGQQPVDQEMDRAMKESLRMEEERRRMSYMSPQGQQQMKRRSQQYAVEMSPMDMANQRRATAAQQAQAQRSPSPSRGRGPSPSQAQGHGGPGGRLGVQQDPTRRRSMAHIPPADAVGQPVIFQSPPGYEEAARQSPAHAGYDPQSAAALEEAAIQAAIRASMADAASRPSVGAAEGARRNSHSVNSGAPLAHFKFVAYAPGEESLQVPNPSAPPPSYQSAVAAEPSRSQSRSQSQAKPRSAAAAAASAKAAGAAVPLPAGWKEYRTNDNRPYWFNSESGVTSWTRPGS